MVVGGGPWCWLSKVVADGSCYWRSLRVVVIGGSWWCQSVVVTCDRCQSEVVIGGVCQWWSVVVAVDQWWIQLVNVDVNC